MMQYDLSKVRVFWGDVELKPASAADFAFTVQADPKRGPRPEPTGRDEAETRLAGIVAELERLAPGCTSVACTSSGGPAASDMYTGAPRAATCAARRQNAPGSAEVVHVCAGI